MHVERVERQVLAAQQAVAVYRAAGATGRDGRPPDAPGMDEAIADLNAQLEAAPRRLTAREAAIRSLGA